MPRHKATPSGGGGGAWKSKSAEMARNRAAKSGRSRPANAEPSGGGGGIWRREGQATAARRAALAAQAKAIPGGARGGMNPATNPVVAQSLKTAERRKARQLGNPQANGENNDLRGTLTHRTTTDPYRRAVGTQEWVKDKIEAGDIEGGMSAGQSGTSIFDPVVCELMYRWFCPPGGQILDPFAGGSVRGIVASKLGRRYFGVDLSARQVAANIRQAKEILGKGDPKPEWRVGDSAKLATLAKDVKADFIFSCPPYADLEVYSDDALDLSTMPYPQFRKVYDSIIAGAVAKLKNDRFACFVVGDARGEDGCYYGLPWHTVESFERAGAKLYNEAVLVTAVGSLPIRTRKQFEASRKFGKTHQNVLVFCKGDFVAATKAIGPVEFGDLEGVESTVERRPIQGNGFSQESGVTFGTIKVQKLSGAGPADLSKYGREL